MFSHRCSPSVVMLLGRCDKAELTRDGFFNFWTFRLPGSCLEWNQDVTWGPIQSPLPWTAHSYRRGNCCTWCNKAPPAPVVSPYRWCWGSTWQCYPHASGGSTGSPLLIIAAFQGRAGWHSWGWGVGVGRSGAGALCSTTVTIWRVQESDQPFDGHRPLPHLPNPCQQDIALLHQ